MSHRPKIKQKANKKEFELEDYEFVLINTLRELIETLRGLKDGR